MSEIENIEPTIDKKIEPTIDGKGKFEDHLPRLQRQV